eukprot:3181845-Rhodomonas_salina.3
MERGDGVRRKALSEEGCWCIREGPPAAQDVARATHPPAAWSPVPTPWILDSGPWILDSGPWSLDPRP